MTHFILEHTHSHKDTKAGTTTTTKKPRLMWMKMITSYMKSTYYNNKQNSDLMIWIGYWPAHFFGIRIKKNFHSIIIILRGKWSFHSRKKFREMKNIIIITVDRQDYDNLYIDIDWLTRWMMMMMTRIIQGLRCRMLILYSVFFNVLISEPLFLFTRKNGSFIQWWWFWNINVCVTRI